MRLPTPKLPPRLSRPPVGGLRFVVLRVGEDNVYSSRAVDEKGYTYEIRSDSAGAIILTDREGEDTVHENIDAAETAAGQMNRREHPLKVPKFKWTKHTWREPRFDKGYNTREALIAPACDVPFLGTGHFTSGMSEGFTSRPKLGWDGAQGAWSFHATDVPALATACGIVDPYGAPSAGAYFGATKAEVADLYSVLIKAANKGRKLYRLFPVLPDHERHPFGSLRQVSAWDAWLTTARARKHWIEWTRRKAKRGGDYPAKYRTPIRGYEHTGQALFMTQEVTAELKAGKLRYRKVLPYEKERAGITGPAHRARDIGEAVLVPSHWQGLLYDEFMVETARRGTIGYKDEAPVPRMVKIGHALVEIVEYNDGDKPYVKSLGYFRSLSSEELDIKWGKHPGRTLDVKVYPGTWLTRIADATELGGPALPAPELSGQMELGIVPPG